MSPAETPMSASFTARFLKGETVSAFWNFLSKGIGLFNTLLTISSLTLYQYGVFQLLLSVAGLSSDFFNIGGGVVPNEISRAIGEKREGDAKSIFLTYSYFRAAVAIILWVAVFFGAPIIFSNYDLDFIHNTRIISFLFLTEAAFVIIKTLCIVRLEFGIIGVRNTINKIVQAGILIYFFIQDNLGLHALIWSVIIAASVSVICVIIPFLRVYSPWNKVATSRMRLFFEIFTTFGKWDIVRQISNRVTFRIKPWLIKLFISTEAVAVFTIADMIVSTLQDVLPSKTLQSLIPLWLKDKQLANKLFSYGVKYFLIVGIVLAVFAVIFIPPMINIFFPKYAESIPLFYLMIVNLPIFASGIMMANYVIAHRKQKFLFVAHTVRNLFSLAFILSTLPFIGLWGLAIESVIVPLLMIIAIIIYTKKRDPGFYFDTNIIFGYSNQDKEIVKKAWEVVAGWISRKRGLVQ